MAHQVRRDQQGNFRLSDPTVHTCAEHVYALMAKQPGIDMTETFLLDEGPRAHADEQLFTAMRDFGVFGPDDRWALAPAYDLSFSYQPGHRYIGQQFLSIGGKFAGHTLGDLYGLGNAAGWQVPDIKGNIARVADAVAQFPALAREWEVPVALADRVATRLDALRGEVGL